tara:strand:- start:646 stop:801 length:156 start_codon:yes stop_codon:yes gene_type:complete
MIIGTVFTDYVALNVFTERDAIIVAELISQSIIREYNMRQMFDTNLDGELD